MKKIAIALLSLALISNSACGDNSEIVATYSDGKITSQQIMDHFKPVLDKQKESEGKKFSELDKKIQETLIKNFINIKLLEKEAHNLGISKTKEFKEKLKNAENYLIQQELFTLKTKDAVSQKELDNEYKKLSDIMKGQKEIKVSHILVDSEKTAKEIKSKVFKGSSFESLAKEFSKDESSKVQGGSLGYITKGRLVPEFEDKVFSMKKNEVSSPVKTNFGWHVIKVYDIRDIKIPAQKDIEHELKSKLTNDIIKKYIQELEQSAKIELKI